MSLVIAGNSAGGYNLTKSLRFRKSASAYMNRTPGSAGNRKKWTWSGWVKRGVFGASGNNQFLMSCGTAYSQYGWMGIGFFDGNAGGTGLQFQLSEGANGAIRRTAAVFRDPSAWYHFVVAFDSTQATDANRAIIYVNGVQQTLDVNLSVTLNADYGMNQALATNIGADAIGNVTTFDGYMAEVNFIDGQALTPSSFGSTNTTTGVWQPARYTGTYGTNGFYLPFTNTTSTTTLGYDFSGNSNNWTTNNISLSGVANDSVTDTPSLLNSTTANYCVLNPLNSSCVITNGNLTASSTAGNTLGCGGSIGMSSGQFYFEHTIGLLSGASSAIFVGVSLASSTSPATPSPVSFAYGYAYANTGIYRTPSSDTAYGATFTTGDVIGIAYDATNNTITFYKNGVSQGQKTGLIAGTYIPWIYYGGNNNTNIVYSNFGQQPFTYTPPTGFKALNTYNLPDSTIVKGNRVMDATLYTGTGNVANTITNASGFKPDLVWVKSRSNGYDHLLYDSVRGTGTTKGLSCNITNIEGANAAFANLTSFDSNGFSVGTTSSTNTLNNSGSTFVGWQWQAGQGTTSSNTSGSISSTVSVNPTAGFSIVTWTGTGANATVGHGLGVAPSLIITKNRVVGTTDWPVYHASLGATKYIRLNLASEATTSAIAWNNTNPTSSVFSVGTWDSANGNGNAMVTYCWTPIAGFSQFGGYSGNSSTSGPFIYTGFRPKFVVVRNTTSTAGTDWQMVDSSRSPSNQVGQLLQADLSVAEQTTGVLDFLSNGFRLTSTFVSINASSNDYIYMAFAENPFKNALAR